VGRGQLKAELSDQWVGDRASYRARHERVYSARGKAKDYTCLHCTIKIASDWALVHEKNGLHVNDYIPLCRRCHMVYDQAKLNLPVVRRIRALYFCEDVTHQGLAEKFGVTKRSVTIVLNEIGWIDDGSD
jgi:NAD-dependent SIR2 family protein deacetylase